MPNGDPNSLALTLTRLTDDQNRKVDYTMDMDGTPRSVKFNQAFDGGGNLTQYAQADYTYDLDTGNSKTHNWLKQIKQTWNRQTSPYPFPNGTWSQTTLVQYAYTLDAAGMRLTNAVSDSGGPVRTESYGYDELYRLTSVNYGDGQTQSYTFDAMGNRLSKTDAGGGINGTENYAYNAANMLLTRGAASYANDSNGNTLTGGGRTSTWDSQNRLRQCAYGGVTTTHTYDAGGIRHRTVNGANTTDYVLDGPMFVRELLNGAVNATYLVGLRGPEYRRDAAGTVRWYLYDGLGSCSGEVDPNGNITASRKFDVYGSVRSTTGTSTTKHKFCGSLGHPSEDETGLIYMRARYMDPVTGRFISEDPKQDGTNWFEYAGSSPTNGVDPSGRSYASVFTGLMMALALILGCAIGYIVMTLLLEWLCAGYKGGNLFGGALMALGTTLLGFALGLMASADDLKKGNMSITQFAKGLARNLPDNAVSKVAGAAALAFVVGIIIGVANALYEYFNSDYYAFGA